MHRGMLGLALVASVGLVIAACHGPVVAHPFTNTTRYLCCNMHYEKPEISDVNYQVGTLIPFGTKVQILEVRKEAVTFLPVGHPKITLIMKYGKDFLPMNQYLERIFVAEDPHLKLKKVPSKTVKLIEQGQVDPGMTRDQVLLAMGYPPAHRTPSLEANQWNYWENRWHEFPIFFDGNKVARVQR